MNEIERAIAEIEGTRFGLDQCHESTMRLAHSALKEKLSRQENAPLTCDGCRREDFQWVDECIGCVRQSHHEDRYEPKGEPPCTQD